MAKSVGGVTAQYLVDTYNPTGYAQVVEESQGGSVTRTYTYGHDLISQRQTINGNWMVSYYGYDGHGSVRLLTDTSGAVTDTYTYDAFGSLIARTGSTPNEYLYAGERFDAETGMYHLRARYMNPSTGRFWTMDSFEGSSYDPLSLHKYVYGHGNPAGNIDPSGNSVVAADRFIAIGVLVVIAALALIPLAILVSNITETIKRQKTVKYVYRETDRPNSPKSVALSREIDWKTGLSFSLVQPSGNYLKYNIGNLLVAGFSVIPNEGQDVIDIHNGQKLRDAPYGSGHVSVYLHDLSRWDAWYEAEKEFKGIQGVSAETLALFELRDKGP